MELSKSFFFRWIGTNLPRLSQVETAAVISAWLIWKALGQATARTEKSLVRNPEGKAASSALLKEVGRMQ